MNQVQKKQQVIIAGGGTAGWMTAAAISKLVGKNLDVTLLESDEIGTVGVGEATIPTLHIFHQLLGIKESEVMAATNATFKLGIMFENWRDKNQDYLHSFGFLGKDSWAAQFHHFWLKGSKKNFVQPIGDYCTEHLAAREHRFAVYPNQELNHAYHLDATLYAKYLRKFAETHGVKRLEGKIIDVNIKNENGYIDSLLLASGETLAGDLFIDCTGFGGLLIEKALHTGFEDWSHWLPCDRAIAVQTTSTEGDFSPYTRSIARDYGWQWRIPLQSRTGNGFVFCSKYLSDDEAINILTKNIEGEMLTKPRVIPFRTGTRRKHWNKNCVAIGLSGGFIEPLESTSIHLIQKGIIQLLLLFPSQGIQQANVDEFNTVIKNQMENIRDFIILHYHVTEREDTKFWQYCKKMSIPDSLQHRLDLFAENAQIYKHDYELFGHSSWVQVMLGQGIIPKRYHPIVDLMSDDELENFLNNVKIGVYSAVLEMPNHRDFINRYCKSKILPLPLDKEGVNVENFNEKIYETVEFSKLMIRTIGTEQTPLITAENFSPSIIKNLRDYAKTITFGFDGNNFYPGIRSALPVGYVDSLMKYLVPYLYEIYKIPQDLKPKVIQADYSMITQQEHTLQEIQCTPHTDTLTPYGFAVLHYLSEGDHGGTGFFRHLPTGFEKIRSEDKFYYYEQKEAFFAKHGRPEKKYMTEGNDHYQLYDRIAYQADKLAVYPGILLHSALLDINKDISFDVDTGRLTANIFIKFE